MKTRTIILATAIVTAFAALTVQAEQTGAPYVGHSRTDYTGARSQSRIHGGAGGMVFNTLLGGQLFSTNVTYIHRGILLPNSSIGEHAHPAMEEMFFIFNGPAEFTVNGKTSTLPAGSCAPCIMGDSHGVLNRSASDTLQWMNIGITQVKGRGGAQDFGKDLMDRTPESPVPFKHATFDRKLLKPLDKAHGGKGTIQYRRLYTSDVFKTNWESLDHIVLPAGTSIGYHKNIDMEEVYYVMSGTGRVVVNNTPIDIKAWDAVPGTLNDSIGIVNNSKGDLEILVLTISMAKGKTTQTDLGDDLSSR